MVDECVWLLRDIFGMPDKRQVCEMCGSGTSVAYHVTYAGRPMCMSLYTYRARSAQIRQRYRYRCDRCGVWCVPTAVEY